MNADMMRGLPGKTITSFSNDSAMGDESAPDHYSLEFLNSLDPNSMPPHELKLRSGAPVMLLRNYSSQKGLCNGTRAVVRGMWQRFLQQRMVDSRMPADDWRNSLSTSRTLMLVPP